MVANIIVDVVMISLILLGFVIGWKKGFIKIIAKPVKLVASFAIASSLSSWLNEVLIEPKIGASLLSRISDFISEKCAGLTSETASGELPTIVKIAAAIFNINIDETVSGAGDSIAQALIDNLAVPTVHVISTVISFILMFFIALIVLSLAIVIINAAINGTPFAVINRTFGLVFFGALAFIVDWLLVMLFGFLRGQPAFAEVAWMQDFSGGFFFNFLSRFDLVEMLLSF